MFRRLMSLVITRLTLLVGILLLSACASTAERSRPTEKRIDIRELRVQAQSQGKFVLVSFYSSTCVHCEELDRATWSDSALRDWVETYCVAARADEHKQPDLAAALNVTKFPTTIMLKTDQSEVARFEGVLAPTALISVLRHSAIKSRSSNPISRRSTQEYTTAFALPGRDQASHVRVSVIDSVTRAPVRVDKVQWLATEDPIRYADLVPALADKTNGTFSFRCDPGVVQILCPPSGEGHDSGYMTATVVAGANNIALLVPRASGLSIRVRDGSHPIPLDFDLSVGFVVNEDGPSGSGHVTSSNCSAQALRLYVSSPGKYRVQMRNVPLGYDRPNVQIVEVEQGKMTPVVFELAKEAGRAPAQNL